MLADSANILPAQTTYSTHADLFQDGFSRVSTRGELQKCPPYLPAPESLFLDFLKEHADFRKYVQEQFETIEAQLESVHRTARPSLSTAHHSERPSAKTDASCKPSDETHPPKTEEAVEIPVREANSSPSSLRLGNMPEASPAEVRANKIKELVSVDDQHWLVKFTKSHLFEFVMGGVIVINVFCTAIHIQWQSYSVAYGLGLRSNDAGFSDVEFAFEVLENLFCIIYLVELFLRFYAFGFGFWKHVINVMDALVVIITGVETLFLRHVYNDSAASRFNMLRLFRAFRVLRVAKVVRFAEHFRELRMLVRTLFVSLRGMFWSMILVLFIVFSSAIFLSALLEPFMQDGSISLQLRHAMFDKFGTMPGSFETMFESTFTGAWQVSSRVLINDFSPIFWLYWIPYVVFVNFTLLRVISALFLKQMFEIADHDSERVAMHKKTERERFASELRSIFQEADTSGDGIISKDEFDSMMTSTSVVEHFLSLGLEVDDVTALFKVLSADDDVVDYDELLNGALKMKNNARTMDAIQIMHQQLTTNRAIEDIACRLEARGIIKKHSRIGISRLNLEI